MFEKVNEPNRDMQARAKTDEFSAISAFGQTINELFINGKLMDKSNYEIEQLMLNNAKTKEETRNIIKTWDLIDQNIKGAKLSNMMADIETKMFKETGLTRNSADWLKIINKLFDGILGR